MFLNAIRCDLCDAIVEDEHQPCRSGKIFTRASVLETPTENVYLSMRMPRKTVICVGCQAKPISELLAHLKISDSWVPQQPVEGAPDLPPWAV
jgi:hypothetical protein